MTIYNFAMLNVPFANGAISTEITPFPDWNRGLGIAFEQSEGKPEMKGLNGLFQVLTTSVLYLKQRGIAEWDATLEYPANAFVTDGARLYKSKRVNTNKQPSISQLDWDVWASISDISVSTNGNLKKTVAADGSMTLEVPTATDSQRGAVRQATSTEVANKSNVNAYVTPSNASTIAQTTDLGVGQKWQNVTSSRNVGTTYTNNTGKPITICVTKQLRGNQGYIQVDGINIAYFHNGDDGLTNTVIVPNGSTYRVTGINNLSLWAELR